MALFKASGSTWVLIPSYYLIKLIGDTTNYTIIILFLYCIFIKFK